MADESNHGGAPAVCAGRWHDIAALAELDPEFPLGLELDGQKIGVFLLDDDRVCALENVCPHAEALLSLGFISDGLVECPMHGARFDIATGKHLDPIAGRDLRCFQTRVVGGRVQIKV
jgi:nitrite reductase/ring-hydroxylating ferredoxin subunit